MVLKERLTLEQYVEDFRDIDLTEETRCHLMRRLRERQDEMTSADVIKVAGGVTGEHYDSAKSALRDLELWTRKRIHDRIAGERFRDFLENHY